LQRALEGRVVELAGAAWATHVVAMDVLADGETRARLS
jgi:hypothetical protein